VVSGPQGERRPERGPKGDRGAKGEEGALPRRARRSLLIRDIVIIVLLLLNFLFTAHYVNSTEASRAAAQHQQAVAGCRQFGGLVQSISAANEQTRHAVAAPKSFGALFSEAVSSYYAKTGCEALTREQGDK
jgi:hypothetical protein